MENKFEELKVWQKAHGLVLEVYQITRMFPQDERYAMVNQLRRCSSSVAANIAEGNGRKTKPEYIQFLYNAKGSLEETKYFLILARDLEYIDDKKFATLNCKAQDTGRLLNGLIRYLKSKN